MKSIPEISVEARLIYQAFTKLSPGESISYEELSEITGGDIRQNRGVIYTAINRAQQDDGIIIGCVRKHGYKRLRDEEIASIGDYSISRIRRESRRGLNRVVKVQDFQALPEELKVKHNTSASILSAIHGALRKKALRCVESRVRESVDKLPLAKTLEAFKGGVEEEDEDK